LDQFTTLKWEVIEQAKNRISADQVDPSNRA
jgi:hypothetical protein